MMRMRSVITLVLLGAFMVSASGCHMFHRRDKNVVKVCLKCGEVKGTDKCCAADAEKCAKCKLNKGSVGCCRNLPKCPCGDAAKLCAKCGQVKGSNACCKADAPKCGKCELAKGSPGCCKLGK